MQVRAAAESWLTRFANRQMYYALWSLAGVASYRSNTIHAFHAVSTTYRHSPRKGSPYVPPRATERAPGFHLSYSPSSLVQHRLLRSGRIGSLALTQYVSSDGRACSSVLLGATTAVGLAPGVRGQECKI